MYTNINNQVTAIPEKIMQFFENVQISRIRWCAKLQLNALHLTRFKPRTSHAFVLFLTGEVRYTYPDNNIIIAEPNSFLYLPQGVEFDFHPQKPSSCLVVNFHTVNSPAQEAFGASYRNITKIRDCMLSAVNAYKNQNAGFKAEVFSEVYKIISLIQKNELNNYVSPEQRKKLQPAIEHIEKHFLDTDIKISELVKLCGMSEKYFTTLFTHYYQTGAKQYIIHKKLEHARAMLESTASSVTEISEACGFSSVYYFSKLFKQRTGMTPTDYRRINIY